MNYPQSVTVVEVGPRDGLQNESGMLSPLQKSTLVNHLSESGLPVIETGSFVSARWVPQMANSDQVFRSIERRSGTRYSALVPNERGFDDAASAMADEVAIFAAVTETFSQKNLNASIEQTLERFAPVLAKARVLQLPVRGYLSCVLGCPYEGDVHPSVVSQLSQHLLDAGCYEISLGDTIGTGTAGSMTRLLLQLLADGISPAKLAVHCHDTYGQALSNIVIALQHGIDTIDASIGGLGGCPYAPGAGGNVATEDVIYMLDGFGIEHGVDMQKLLVAGNYISDQLGRETQSRTARAIARASS